MKKAKIILLALMALLAIAGLFVTLKPLMERASRQKQVDEANDSRHRPVGNSNDP